MAQAWGLSRALLLHYHYGKRVYAYDDAVATLLRPKRRSCAYFRFSTILFKVRELNGLAAVGYQLWKNMNEIVVMLQLAIMNHRLTRLDDEIQARRRRKMFWVHPWLHAAGGLQFGHYDQLMRGSTSFFNYMRMEPYLYDEIFHRAGRRIQVSCPGLDLAFRFWLLDIDFISFLFFFFANINHFIVIHNILPGFNKFLFLFIFVFQFYIFIIINRLLNWLQ